jgi:hypothetical protein
MIAISDKLVASTLQAKRELEVIEAEEEIGSEDPDSLDGLDADAQHLATADVVNLDEPLKLRVSEAHKASTGAVPARAGETDRTHPSQLASRLHECHRSSKAKVAFRGIVVIEDDEPVSRVCPANRKPHSNRDPARRPEVLLLREVVDRHR